jgi:hypothetical protein
MAGEQNPDEKVILSRNVLAEMTIPGGVVTIPAVTNAFETEVSGPKSREDTGMIPMFTKNGYMTFP